MKIDKIDTSGRAEIVQDNGANADGTKAETRWNVPPNQLAQHLAMFTQPDDQGRKLSAGDASALADAANDYAKKRAKGEA